MGLWADMDLGWPFDDYIGFDSTHRLGYVYNGTSFDGTGGPGTYGSHTPIVGVSVLQMPGDGTTLAPIGSFMYHNNDFSAYGNPSVDTEYYNYLNAKWRDGSHLKNDFAGKGTPSTGHGTGPNTNYAFTGNPADTTQWSECTSGNLPADRRFIIATNDYSFAASQTVNFAFALVIDSLGGGCPNTSITNIIDNTDSAWKYYNDTSSIPTSVFQPPVCQNILNIYPNPARTILNIDIAGTPGSKANIIVYDILGRAKNVTYIQKQNMVELNVSNLAAGVYTISYYNDAVHQTALFVKE